jgi:hypothetical protein
LIVCRTLLRQTTTKGMKTVYTYKLKYRADDDDMDPKTHTSETPINQGDIIEIDSGNYHYVSLCHKLKSGVQLELSKSGQDLDDAYLLAEQYGHL